MSRCVVALAVFLFSLSAHPARAGAPRPSRSYVAEERLAVQTWLREHAIALDTVRAGHGFADMQPLRAIVGDAHIVALGEATHGTREFFQMKHRMLEFLVREMGFTVFAIEASTPEAAAVNDYVLHGNGKAAAAVAGMGFWTWNTEEVVEMVEWMRAYNADPRNTRKVQFLGFDMQNPPASLKRLVRYLETVDADAAPSITSSLAPLAKQAATAFAKRNVQQMLAPALEEVETLLATNRERYVAKTSEEEWASALHEVDLLRQGARFRSTPIAARSAARDAAMAENVQWILKSQPQGTRIVLWAHNYHVGVGAGAGPRTLGSHLREAYGNDLRIFGFAFGYGGFQAVDGRSRRLRRFTVPGARAETFDGMLASSEIPLFAIDLRTASGEVSRWLSRPLEHRSIGAVYVDQTPAIVSWRTLRIDREYDAVFFVAKTTPSSVLGRVRR